MAPTSEAEAIKRTYLEFTAALDRAHTVPNSTRRDHLSRYMADPQLSRVLNRIEELRTDGYVSYGAAVPHVKSVHIKGNEAVLRDCLDSSNVGLMRVADGEKVDHGVKKEDIKAYMIKGADGQWRVSKAVSLGEGC